MLARSPAARLMTLNINGFHSKKIRLAELLEKERVAVCSLQETLVKEYQYPPVLAGYNSFWKPWQEGFRGMAVLVDDRLTSYQIPHEKEQLEGYRFLIHVKVSGFGGQPPMHIIGCYFPSGGSVRSLRTSALHALVHLIESIMRFEPQACVVGMGDMNMVSSMLDRMLTKSVYATRFRPVGSDYSRFPKRGSMKAIDHLVVSDRARLVFNTPRVLRDYSLSDHRPLISAMRTTVQSPADPPHLRCGLTPRL